MENNLFTLVIFAKFCMSQRSATSAALEQQQVDKKSSIKPNIMVVITVGSRTTGQKEKQQQQNKYRSYTNNGLAEQRTEYVSLCVWMCGVLYLFMCVNINSVVN